jgi:hypothetical protein
MMVGMGEWEGGRGAEMKRGEERRRGEEGRRGRGERKGFFAVLSG